MLCMTCCRSYSHRENDLLNPKQKVVGYPQTFGSFVLPAFARMCLIDINEYGYDRINAFNKSNMDMYEDVWRMYEDV
jgi:hypothetical protein